MSHLKALLPLKWTETFVNVSQIKLYTLVPLVEIYLKSILMKLYSLGNKEQNLYTVWVCTEHYPRDTNHSSITIKIKANRIYIFLVILREIIANDKFGLSPVWCDYETYVTKTLFQKWTRIKHSGYVLALNHKPVHYGVFCGYVFLKVSLWNYSFL